MSCCCSCVRFCLFYLHQKIYSTTQLTLHIQNTLIGGMMHYFTTCVTCDDHDSTWINNGKVLNKTTSWLKIACIIVGWFIFRKMNEIAKGQKPFPGIASGWITYCRKSLTDYVVYMNECSFWKICIASEQYQKCHHRDSFLFLLRNTKFFRYTLW